MTQVLRREGLLEADRIITAIDVRAVGDADRGLTSDTAFLALTFDGQSTCPASMACKMAGPKLDMKILMKLANMVPAEIGFLRMQMDGRTSANLQVPQLYYAYHNKRTEHFMILMQDMRPARPGKQLQGCQVSEAHGVLKLLAQLHGRYWENYQAALSFTTLPNSPKRNFVNFILSDSWPKFVKWASPHVDAGRLPSLQVATRVAEEVLSSKGSWMQEMATPPLSVIHGDCHSENYLWPQGTESSAEKVVAIDWQLCVVGQPSFDVANFLVMSMDAAMLQEKEEELIRFYYRELPTQISSQFSMDQLHHRYNAGICYNLLLEAIGQATMDAAELANEEIQNKRLVIFDRILNALNRTASATIFFTRMESASQPLVYGTFDKPQESGPHLENAALRYAAP